MVKKLVQEILVPTEYGKGYVVKKGQTMRIIAIEGPQIGDMAILSANDHKETYDAGMSYILNCLQNTGDARHLKYLYSRAPWMNVMFTVTDDPVASHWVMMGGKCNMKIHKLRNPEGVKHGYRRNCYDNIQEALEPFGVPYDADPQVFNLWMNVGMTPDGAYQYAATKAKKGDYIDMVAEMDCLVALSACPTSGNTPSNAGVNKPLKVEIWE